MRSFEYVDAVAENPSPAKSGDSGRLLPREEAAILAERADSKKRRDPERMAALLFKRQSEELITC